MKSHSALLLAVALTALLSGCAEYAACRRCAAHGCPADARITGEVEDLLGQYPALGPPNQVYVRTLDRVVYLSGQVATDLERENAEALASQTPGVRGVVDIIGLSYSGR